MCSYIPSASSILDSGCLPHWVIRYGIRQQLRQRLKQIASPGLAEAYERKISYIQALKMSPITVQTKRASWQPYEVGAGMLQTCLGVRAKHSCCLYDPIIEEGKDEGVCGEWEGPAHCLDEAEERMLDLYVQRARIKNGHRILDLGCGWGSTSLYLARRFPNSRVTAFSGSRAQKEYIDRQASTQGLTNLQTVVGDIVDYQFDPEAYDRVISVELFEHMKNYEMLMRKVAGALRPGGKLFVHMFCHKDTPYDFEDGWVEKFFTGKTMPSADLLLWFQRHLKCSRQWWVCGRNYARTCEDWLMSITKNKNKIWSYLEDTYGTEKAAAWYYRWQVFYMVCAELFAYGDGDIWGVSHYLFEKPTGRADEDEDCEHFKPLPRKVGPGIVAGMG